MDINSLDENSRTQKGLNRRRYGTKQAQAVIQDRAAGMPYAEIATKHGVSLNGARRICARAIRAGTVTAEQMHCCKRYGIKRAPKSGPSDAEYIERVKSRVKIDENGCWLWQGFVNPWNGYADISYRGKCIRVHRLMYKLSGRELRAGLDVCHSCDQPTCCNPDHLWQGTAKDNMRDASLKGRIYLQRKTHCIRGHEFTPENTKLSSNKHGHIMRSCRECSRLRQKKDSGWTPMRKYGRERDKKRLGTQRF